MALAIERLTILAAIILVDEQRWDGQERSTRYQDFRKSGYYTPDFGGDAAAARLYRETADFLFAEYEWLGGAMFDYLAARTPKPAEMKQEAYERTLRARAFDFARYLLPMATNTSLGQIVNARTLETQVARLLSSPYGEVRRLGEKLKSAAREAAWNVNRDRLAALVEEIRALDPALGARAGQELLKDVRVAPTLVKYAETNRYRQETEREMTQLARELLAGQKIESAPPVDLLEDEPVEIELAATLLYEFCAHPYRQVRRVVEGLPGAGRKEIVAMGTRHRSRHDELLRAFSAGQRFRFDILMDLGGFRDMHRHRRCVQISQPFTAAHGHDTPAEIPDAGHGTRYAAAMRRAAGAVQSLAQREDHAGDYLLPLGVRHRTLFKMDLAEAVYISELRTGPAGHFSYRNVAYGMYEAVAKRHPELAGLFRVTDVNEPVDLLKR